MKMLNDNLRYNKEASMGEFNFLNFFDKNE